MYPLPCCILTAISILILCLNIQAQDSPSGADKAIALPQKLFTALDKKASSISDKLDHQTGKYLNKLAKKETRLKRKLWKKDSTLAKQLFPDIEGQYAIMKATSGTVSKYSQVYNG